MMFSNSNIMKQKELLVNTVIGVLTTKTEEKSSTKDPNTSPMKLPT